MFDKYAAQPISLEEVAKVDSVALMAPASGSDRKTANKFRYRARVVREAQDSSPGQVRALVEVQRLGLGFSVPVGTLAMSDHAASVGQVVTLLPGVVFLD